ncbi:MAG TPA: carotenoid biosynthesis protein [Anaerolineae bacterium]|nr:carotenoid biosynthesis protein [Anaerolineae bacterium]HQI84780.1 carotenoid biosynthesis protein [Anaerolineae bacterium]
MEYLFDTLIPTPWLLADILTLLVSLVVVAFVIQKSKHPVSVLLEGFGFVFLYASLFENFAVVRGWYVYGRSFLMVGDVPLSVPLIEMDVMIVGLWLLQKMDIPDWCKPFVLGLWGMLQDFSLDPVAVRQVFTVQGVTSGRWTWLIEPGVANIYDIPVYNFPGWMLIMMYATFTILIGRWWFKRSGYKPVAGYVYPLLATFVALVILVTPLSNFLLWLEPFFVKGSAAEWVMLGFHLLFPTVLLAIFWRGKMKAPLSLKDDFPIFAVPLVFHLADILFAIAGGFSEVLWLVLLAGLVHCALLGWIWMKGKRVGSQQARQEFYVGP